MQNFAGQLILGRELFHRTAFVYLLLRRRDYAGQRLQIHNRHHGFQLWLLLGTELSTLERIGCHPGRLLLLREPNWGHVLLRPRVLRQLVLGRTRTREYPNLTGQIARILPHI